MVVLVAGLSTKETFAILTIENSRVYLAEPSHLARAYPGFLHMKPLGLFSLPPGWDPSPLQGYSLGNIAFSSTFYTLG